MFDCGRKLKSAHLLLGASVVCALVAGPAGIAGATQVLPTLPPVVVVDPGTSDPEATAPPTPTETAPPEQPAPDLTPPVPEGDAPVPPAIEAPAVQPPVVPVEVHAATETAPEVVLPTAAPEPRGLMEATHETPSTEEAAPVISSPTEPAETIAVAVAAAPVRPAAAIESTVQAAVAVATGSPAWVQAIVVALLLGLGYGYFRFLGSSRVAGAPRTGKS